MDQGKFTVVVAFTSNADVENIIGGLTTQIDERNLQVPHLAYALSLKPEVLSEVFHEAITDALNDALFLHQAAISAPVTLEMLQAHLSQTEFESRKEELVRDMELSDQLVKRAESHPIIQKYGFDILCEDSDTDTKNHSLSTGPC